MLPVISLGLTYTKAYSHCTIGGAIFTVAGVWCHFHHKTFTAVENATIASIEGISNDAVDVGNFTITHHPVRLAYDYVTTATQGSNVEAISQLKGSGKDILNLDFGVAKGSANLAYNVYSLVHWGDLSQCIITNAVAAKKAMSAPTVQLSMSAGQDVMKKCLTEKFKAVATPAIFNITGRRLA